MKLPLAEAFVALDTERCVALVRQNIEEGIEVTRIIDACRIGMTAVGDRYAAGEFYLSELVMAADIFSQCAALLEPLIGSAANVALGTVVVGTVAGDIHDLGKNILIALLRAEGFHVVDLGVDVPAERFVEAALETKARIVGLSCLLTVAFDAMRATVQAFEDAGIRNEVTLLIGGSIVSERVCRDVGADGYATDAVLGVRRCVALATGKGNTGMGGAL
jgi:methanogenic corrinoid protein MtbC1